MHYKICWNTAECNLFVDEVKIKTSFFKDDITFGAMKKEREEYDKKNESPPTFHLLKKTKKTRPPNKKKKTTKNTRTKDASDPSLSPEE